MCFVVFKVCRVFVVGSRCGLGVGVFVLYKGVFVCSGGGRYGRYKVI